MQSLEFLEEVKYRVGDYKDPETESGPNSDVLAQVGQAEVFVLMGPSGIGKNTQESRLVEAVGRMSGGLSVVEVPSITTRAPRTEEQGPDGVDPYLWHCDTESQSEQERLIGMFEEGRIVQATMLPETGTMYASLAESYAVSTDGRRVVNIADFMIEEFLRLAVLKFFGKQHGAYLTTQDNGKWMGKLQDRGDGLVDPSADPLMWRAAIGRFMQRLVEADRSLGTCLTEDEIVRRSIRFVRTDYGDELDPATGMTQTTGRLWAALTAHDKYEDLDARGDVSSMRDYARGVTFGVQLVQQREPEPLMAAS